MIRFDCHAHVYETLQSVPGARYTPAATAPLVRWQEHLASHNLQGGVIVQVSFLGTDNSELCNALQRLPETHFAGIAVVDLDVPDDELDKLAALGIKGCRWNLVKGAIIPDLNEPRVLSFLERIYARDMHIEIHLESPLLAEFIMPLLDVGGVVVVDHMGLPSHHLAEHDPWLTTLKQHNNRISRLYVKLSGGYRTPFNTQEHVDTLLNLLPPERFIWGSDWPHTQHQQDIDFQQMAHTRHALPIGCDRAAVQALYGLTAD